MSDEGTVRDEIAKDLVEAGLCKSKKAGRNMVDIVLAGIGNVLMRGEDAQFRGFGTFSVYGREPYAGRNPKTGERMTIEAKNIVKFKPSKSLTDSVN